MQLKMTQGRKRRVSCSICRKRGHNKRRCPSGDVAQSSRADEAADYQFDSTSKGGHSAPSRKETLTAGEAHTTTVSTRSIRRVTFKVGDGVDVTDVCQQTGSSCIQTSQQPSLQDSPELEVGRLHQQTISLRSSPVSERVEGDLIAKSEIGSPVQEEHTEWSATALTIYSGTAQEPTTTERFRLLYVLHNLQPNELCHLLGTKILESEANVEALAMLLPREDFPSASTINTCSRCSKQYDVNYNFRTACQLPHEDHGAECSEPRCIRCGLYLGQLENMFDAGICFSGPHVEYPADTEDTSSLTAHH